MKFIKKVKRNLGSILLFVFATGVLVAFVVILLYLEKRAEKEKWANLVDTGEKETACTIEWTNDKKIENCKKYEIYRPK